MCKLGQICSFAILLLVLADHAAFASPQNSMFSTPSVTLRPHTHAGRRPKAKAAFLASGDAQALSIATNALRALVGIRVITDATVRGNATYVAGSDQETGSATLEGRAGHQSRVVLSLSGGERSEIHEASTGVPQGKRANTDQMWHPMPLHTCWNDPTWFFPALTLQSALSDPQITFSYVGQENKENVETQHIQISRIVPGQTASVTSLIQRLSQVDIYVDSATHLPVAIDFNIHPDTDAGTNLPVEIQFSDWQAVNGIQMPSRIERFLQGSLTLDLTSLEVSVNSGIPLSHFSM